MNSSISSSKLFRSLIPIFFLGYLILGLFLVDKLLTTSLKNANQNDYAIWTKVIDGKIDADIAVVGSSRALVHYDCSLIESLTTYRDCINLGLNGSGHMLQLPLVSAYLRHNKAPSTMIISLDAASLVPNKQTIKIFRPQQYVPYLSDDILYNQLSELDPVFTKLRYVPMYKFGLYKDSLEQSLITLLHLHQNWTRDRDEKGYRPTDKDWDGSFDDLVEANPEGFNYPIENDSVNAILDIIQLAKAHNIKVILVYAPEYREFTELLNNYDQILMKFKSIAEESGVAFYDYSDDDRLVINRDNFYNSQHMTATAADSYTRIIAEEVLNQSP